MFLEINQDPSRPSPHVLGKQYINIDNIQEAVIFGPIIHNAQGVDLEKSESIIDEGKYEIYRTQLEEPFPLYELHILLKSGELITRPYLSNQLAELKKIYFVMSKNSIILDDLILKSSFSGKIKFYTRSEKFDENSSDPKKVEYKEVEISASVELGDGKYALISKVIDLLRDIFKTTPKSNR